jgi:hypothetical protein
MAIIHRQFHGQHPPTTARFFDRLLCHCLLFEDIMDSSTGKLQELSL